MNALCLGRDLKEEGHSYMKSAIHPQYTKFLMTVVIPPSVRMRTSYLDSLSCELQAAAAPLNRFSFRRCFLRGVRAAAD